MREESVETMNVCTSLNAFFISILSLIVSVATAVASGQEENPAVQFMLAVFGITAIIGIIVILLSAWRRSVKIAKRADRYRSAYIMLSFMPDQKTGQLQPEGHVNQAVPAKTESEERKIDCKTNNADI